MAVSQKPDTPNDIKAREALARDLDRIDRVARLMDAQFTLPLIRVPIGLDGLIGLIPGIGDAVVFLPSAWMLERGWHHGARKRVLLRMATNSGIDFVVGAIPLVGDLFDIGYKANLKNAALLRAEFAPRLEAP
ncbi:DUF4112 domain-containing protein [Roseovarius aquimarinus]|uniref:DUF4112 domain-containing protein n=1 Tax=Roseovarius aquimarinus TaxID=1229156 RepID=A0ABW7I9N2_9RHOB